MTRICLIVASALFLTEACAQSPDSTKPQPAPAEFRPSPKTLAPAQRQELYLQLIEDFIGWAEEKYWVNTNELEEGGGYYNARGSGVIWERGNSNLCWALAVLLSGRPSQSTFTSHDIPRAQLESHLEKTIRSLCLSNKNYSGKTGRKWGGPAWQASLGCIGTAWAAHLQEAILRDDTIAMWKEVLGHEADALLKRNIHYYKPGNTGAEDGTWNAPVLAFAANKLPDDPRAASWDMGGKKWAIASVAMPGDSKDNTTLVDGHPLAYWVSGWNINADCTLENHGFVHPGYNLEYGRLSAAEMAYKTFGNPIPQAFSFRAQQIWDNLGKVLLLADGDAAYPHGNDWAYKDINHLYYANRHATARGQSEASAFESRAAQFLRKRQLKRGNGSVCKFNFGYHCDVVAGWALSWQTHNNWKSDSVPYDVAEAESYCVRKYPDAKIGIHRNREKIVTLSWHPCGQAIHIMPQEGIDTFPDPPFYFSWQRSSGVTGAVSNSSLHNFQSTHNGQGMRVTVKRPMTSDVDQYITVVSLPNEATVYSTIFHAKNNASYSVGQLFPLQVRWLPESRGAVTQRRGTHWLNMSDYVGFVSPKPLPENIPSDRFWLTETKPSVLGGKVTCKHKPHPRYTLKNAFDGNPSSCWISHGDNGDRAKGPSPQRPDWIEITYPEPREISQVMLQSRQTYGPRQCELLCSDDGTQYRSIRKLTANNTNVNQVFHFQPVKARHFRFQVVSAFDGSATQARNAQIRELYFGKRDGDLEVKAGQWFSPAVAVVYTGQHYEQTKKLSEKINLVENLSNNKLDLTMCSSTGQAVINLWPNP